MTRTTLAALLALALVAGALVALALAAGAALTAAGLLLTATTAGVLALLEGRPAASPARVSGTPAALLAHGELSAPHAPAAPVSELAGLAPGRGPPRGPPPSGESPPDDGPATGRNGGPHMTQIATVPALSVDPRTCSVCKCELLCGRPMAAGPDGLPWCDWCLES